MDSPSHSLAFLLSLGAFPLACAGDDGGSSETSTTGSASTTGEPTTSGSGSAASTESGSTGGTSEGTGETSGGGLCEEYAAKYVECLRGTIPEVTSECMMSLEDALTFYGEECQAATKTMLECYAGGTCEDFFVGTGCSDEVDAVEELCVATPGAVCQVWGAKYAECSDADPIYAALNCQTVINEYIQAYGPDCGAAYEEYFACFSELECVAWEGEDACANAIAKTESFCS